MKKAKEECINLYSRKCTKDTALGKSESIVLTFLVLFQSCAAGLGDAMMDEGGTSGFSGLFVAILMLIGGIVAIAARNSRGGGIFCTILYGLAGLLGLTAQGIFEDLVIWGGLCLIFAVIFLISVIRWEKNPQQPVTKEEKGKTE